MYDLLVVGAGPYGLSAAAHATAAGLNVRVLGRPMASWRDAMPAGMYLRTEPWSTGLSDPSGACALTDYRAADGPATGHGGAPLPLDVYTRYGTWFADRAVPGVEERTVTAVRPCDGHFLVRTADGDALRARTVLLAVGLLPFAHLPVPLRDLPPELATHSSAHHDLSRFRGRQVTVLGAGQSALETATLLSEQGARVRLVTRAEQLDWQDPPQPSERGLPRRLREPHSALGTGWADWTCAELPWAVRGLPGTLRTRITARALHPAGAWWLRERFENTGLPVRLGTRLWSAVPTADGVRLHLGTNRGTETVLETEHVIAATGFVPDLARLRLLDPALRARLRTVRGSRAPELDGGFQSSLPGLYFAGPLAAPAFGPVMRFVHGAAYTARRVTAGLRQHPERERTGARRALPRLPRPATGAARRTVAPQPVPTARPEPAAQGGDPA